MPKRKNFAIEILDRIDNALNHLEKVIFSDKSTFPTSGTVNNICIWGSEQLNNLCHVSRFSGTRLPDVGQHVCALLQEELHVDKHAAGGAHQRGGEVELPGHAAALRGLPVLQGVRRAQEDVGVVHGGAAAEGPQGHGGRLHGRTAQDEREGRRRHSVKYSVEDDLSSYNDV
ncbi:hypothetical protein CDAR_490071 [Caerostris darwini]|uniref:Uncharacterized protein n=1 Tax=Caerostris darwini TaxID=1538125 RepID=A0AAV4TIS9_9ARAC|nr:hypothetical protein CDAR_490071 [Caerostris darwini]